MSFWGWDEIRDGAKLQGFVKSRPLVAGDGDWCFMVAPARGFRDLLTNQSGYTNQNHLIECEIEPPHDVFREDFPSVPYIFIPPEALRKVVIRLLGNPQGQWITVEGAWVRDKGHDVWGNDIGLGGTYDWGKTEIHPVTSILVEHVPPPDNRSRLVDFAVFSDASANFPAKVPHSDEDRHGKFDLPIPLGSTFRIVNELNMCASRTFAIVSSERFLTLECRVASGKASDGKGFYHATIELPGFTLLTYLLSRGADPKAGVREMMSRAQVASVRALFLRLEAATLAPLACKPILEEMDSLQTQIAAIASEEKAFQRNEHGPKPPQDPAFQELEKERQEALRKFVDLARRAQAMGCL